jgi:large subunit ribosomal protein L10
MPSLINELMIGEVGTSLAGAVCLILVDASKLKSGETLKFRKDLRGVGARLRVAKSSILYRTLPAELAQVVPPKGPIGVVVCAGDISAAAKLVNELVKEEKLAVRGGLLEGRALDAKSAAKLADMPTREQANAMVVRVLNAPLVQLVRIANVKPTELVRIIKVKSEETASA